MANSNDAHPEDAYVVNNDDLLIGASSEFNAGNTNENNSDASQNSGSSLADAEDGNGIQADGATSNNNRAAYSLRTDNAGLGFSIKTNQELCRPLQHDITSIKRAIKTKRSRLANAKGLMSFFNSTSLANESPDSVLLQRHEARVLALSKQAEITARTDMLTAYEVESQHKIQKVEFDFKRCGIIGDKIPVLLKRHRQNEALVYKCLEAGQETLRHFTVDANRRVAALQQSIAQFDESYDEALAKQAAVKTASLESTNVAQQLHAGEVERETDLQVAKQLLLSREHDEQRVLSLRQLYANYTNLEIVAECDNQLERQRQTVHDSYQETRSSAQALAVEQDFIAAEMRKAREVEMNLRDEMRILATQEENSRLHVPTQLLSLNSRIEHDRAAVAELRSNLNEHMQWAEIRRKQREEALKVKQVKLMQRQEQEILEKQKQHWLARQQEQQQQQLEKKEIVPVIHRAERTVVVAKSPKKHQDSQSACVKAAVIAAEEKQPAQPPINVQNNNTNKQSPGKLRPSQSFKRPKSPTLPSTMSPAKRMNLRSAAVQSPPRGSAFNNNNMASVQKQLPLLHVTTPITALHSKELPMTSQSTMSSTSSDFCNLSEVAGPVAAKPVDAVLPRSPVKPNVPDNKRTEVGKINIACEKAVGSGRTELRNNGSVKQKFDEQSMVSQFSFSKII